MRSLVSRLIVSLSVIAFQISFLNIVFENIVPQAVVALVIAWTFIRGFSEALPWVISVGILLDAISMSVIGTSSLAFVLIAYSASFLSKRFLVEHQGFGFLMIGLLTAAASFLYQFLLILLLNAASTQTVPFLSSAVSFFGFVHMLWFFGWSIFLCACLYFLVLRIESRLAFYDTRVIVKR